MYAIRPLPAIEQFGYEILHLFYAELLENG
jgi:hypothetical protein